jgi:hypothetical protein
MDWAFLLHNQSRFKIVPASYVPVRILLHAHVAETSPVRERSGCDDPQSCHFGGFTVAVLRELNTADPK